MAHKEHPQINKKTTGHSCCPYRWAALRQEQAFGDPAEEKVRKDTFNVGWPDALCGPQSCLRTAQLLPAGSAWEWLLGTCSLPLHRGAQHQGTKVKASHHMPCPLFNGKSGSQQHRLHRSSLLSGTRSMRTINWMHHMYFIFFLNENHVFIRTAVFGHKSVAGLAPRLCPCAVHGVMSPDRHAREKTELSF